MHHTSPSISPAFDPKSVAECLRQGKDGIWYANGDEKFETVSYPEEGNAECFEVEENSFWFRHRAAAICAAMKNFPPPGPVYDIGGGNGFITRSLLNDGHEAVLLEPGKTGAFNASKRGIPTIICSTLVEARFRENCLPAVGLFDVLEHVKTDHAFLGEIHRCLTPGGRLYVTVPSYAWLWSYEDNEAGHYRRYTTRRLASDLKAAGFNCLYQTHIFSLLPIPLFLVRALPSLFGRVKFSAASNESVHRPRMKGFTGKIWAIEINRINSRRSIPFGSSCMIVAEKSLNSFSSPRL